MTINPDIPEIIQKANMPFVARHPVAVYWSGVFVPFIGLVLESTGVDNAFVASGVLLAILVLAIGMAARHCSKIADLRTIELETLPVKEQKTVRQQ